MMTTKPLILLDIDGVINTDNRHSGAFWTDVRKGGTIHYSPTLVEHLNRWTLNELAEIRWLTDWNERANSVLAPAIGLQLFTLARNEDAKISKLDAFIQNSKKNDPSRLIIWIDDELKSFKELNDKLEQTYHMKYLQYEKNVFTRPNTVFLSPAIGLTPEHVSLVDAILSDPESVSGQSVFHFQAGERLYV
jgi:hypothetical protein